jgi:hypothetical protein
MGHSNSTFEINIDSKGNNRRKNVFSTCHLLLQLLFVTILIANETKIITNETCNSR